ncbi:MAG: ribosome maturation factor RimM [Erysipelotrichaceae bacterium]|nr:ribosome maturation factor RimM [Erysipelotrichaceae bacterium]
MNTILIAKVARPFGIRGELKLVLYTDFPEERFEKGSLIYFKKNGEFVPYKVLSYREDPKGAYITLVGITTMNDAETLRDLEIYKDEEDILPLEDGYYYRDIIGLKVRCGGEEVGVVKNMEDGVAANLVRVLKNDGKEKLVPFQEPFILMVDLDRGFIEIAQMEGLL